MKKIILAMIIALGAVLGNKTTAQEGMSYWHLGVGTVLPINRANVEMAFGYFVQDYISLELGGVYFDSFATNSELKRPEESGRNSFPITAFKGGIKFHTSPDGVISAYFGGDFNWGVIGKVKDYYGHYNTHASHNMVLLGAVGGLSVSLKESFKLFAELKLLYTPGKEDYMEEGAAHTINGGFRFYF